MKRKVIGVATAVFVMLGGYVLYIVNLAGEFETLEPHFDGECQRVRGVPGAEDLQITSDGAGVFFASQDRIALAKGDAPGAIYYLDLITPGSEPVDVTPPLDFAFHPHGLSLWEGDDRVVLMVVSHRRGLLHGDVAGDGPAHAIEIFDVDGTRVQHRRSVTDPLLITPNDVAAVGPDAFYATNDHGSGDPFWRKVEDYSRLGRSHIVFWDGAEMRRFPRDYRYVNGITASRDGRQMYAATTAGQTLYVFDRDLQTNGLDLAREISLSSGLDNINVDENGDLWIATHPKLLTVAKHLRTGEGLSPTQVLRVRRNGWTPDEIFLSDGSDLAAATGVARYGSRMLIGAVLEDGFLDCQLAATPSVSP